MHGVDFDVRSGEVHAIVGENGAGKSTLISIAAGILEANAGEIRIMGRTVDDTDVRAMRARGVSVANQHPALVPDLTVRENLQLVAPGIEDAELQAMLQRVATESLTIDPQERVADLILARRHVVEIARALITRPQVLIFDEPTEPFQEAEVDKLFALIRSLRDEGIAIVYISHRLNEVMQIADRISVLRDGRLIETRRAGEYTPNEVVTLIAGQPLDQVFPPKGTNAETSAPVLETKELAGPGFDGVDLVLRAGEIVGLTGVEGQGQREFLRCLAGIVSRRSGEVRIKGKTHSGESVPASRAAGFGFVPDDRHSEGLFLPMSIRENIGLGIFNRIARGGVIDWADDHRIGGEIAAGLGVKAASIETPVSALSGGNQQKVLIGREIAFGPSVLLVDEPTHGVDIGARSEIYRQLREVADNGTPVLVASSDGIELEGLCDRVEVFSRGRIVQELVGEAVSDEAITEANLHATQLREISGVSERATNSDWRRRLGDHLPAVANLVVAGGIMAAANAVNPLFLSGFNLSMLMTFVCSLAFISAAQLCVMLIGEIDLSLGPLAGLVVVLCSFLMGPDQPPGSIAIAAIAVVLMCMLFGLAQGVLVELLRLPSMVITLATFSGIQGVSLLLRPQPGGRISDLLSDAIGFSVFGIPTGMVAVIAVAVVLQFVLARSSFGRAWRATGSDARASHILGVKARQVRLAAFALAGLLTGCGGLVLASQVGIGTATTGVNYTLLGITAAVLSGAKISGGRGSFLAVLASSLLVQTIMNATPFLRLSDAWQYWLIGGATLVAASFFSLSAGGRALVSAGNR
nr:ATP-binding cassette domain-containing protein [Oricola nitratireducens]